MASRFIIEEDNFVSNTIAEGMYYSSDEEEEFVMMKPPTKKTAKAMPKTRAEKTAKAKPKFIVLLDYDDDIFDFAEKNSALVAEMRNTSCHRDVNEFVITIG
jgi:hypothetical protein